MTGEQLDKIYTVEPKVLITEKSESSITEQGWNEHYLCCCRSNVLSQAASGTPSASCLPGREDTGGFLPLPLQTPEPSEEEECAGKRPLAVCSSFSQP